MIEPMSPHDEQVLMFLVDAQAESIDNWLDLFDALADQAGWLRTDGCTCAPYKDVHAPRCGWVREEDADA